MLQGAGQVPVLLINELVSENTYYRYHTRPRYQYQVLDVKYSVLKIWTSQVPGTRYLAPGPGTL